MYNIGELVGFGFHGDVWELLDHPDQVIKVAWAPLTTQDQEVWTFAHIQATYQYLLQQCFPELAQVFEFQALQLREDRQYYSVVLEKLLPLTSDESKAMKSICLDYNGHIESGKCLQHIHELKAWLDFDAQKMGDFYVALNDLPVIHRDFHRRNIMKDTQGNFKLIDFELLHIKEKSCLEIGSM